MEQVWNKDSSAALLMQSLINAALKEEYEKFFNYKVQNCKMADISLPP